MYRVVVLPLGEGYLWYIRWCEIVWRRLKCSQLAVMRCNVAAEVTRVLRGLYTRKIFWDTNLSRGCNAQHGHPRRERFMI
jgi:hypothetical protein